MRGRESLDELHVKNWRKGWKKKGKKFLEFEKQVNHPIRRLIAKKTAKVGKTVLDVGCATCSDYPLHFKHGIKYMGRDITQQFIERAKRRFPRVDVAYGDVLNLDFEDNSVDVVYCKDVLEHLPPETYKTAIKEMHRVSRKRVMLGFFLAPWNGETEYRVLKKLHWNNRYSKEDILKAISKHKPKKIEVVEDIGYNKSALYVVDK